jgi:prepilin-type N-terminal cleavage/methylation domain-containing protein
MIYFQRKTKGFSLIEVLLVLAIMATVIVSILGYTTQKSSEMRYERTIMQMEHFLNAGLSYYVSFGEWPTLTDLQGTQGNFLPKGIINNAWGLKFSVGTNTTGINPGSQFSVCTSIRGKEVFTAATIIAGRLPIASAIDGGTVINGGTVSCPTTGTETACTTSSVTCTVVSSVNIPGQNLNNARSINFAGLYHNGACVPAPVCPSDNMVPTIMAVPVSVSGMNTEPYTNIYPLSSFTAYVTGTNANDEPGSQPKDCSTNSVAQSCYQDTNTPLPAGNYWRVCLRIITQKGTVKYSVDNMNAGVILALTRCMPKNEYDTPSVQGSQFTVFSP